MESLICPFCNCRESSVIETRTFTFRGVFLKMRTRQCRNCGTRYRSREIKDDDITFSERPPQYLKKPPLQETPPEIDGGVNPEPTPIIDELIKSPIPDSTKELLKDKPKPKKSRKKKVDPPVEIDPPKEDEIDLPKGDVLDPEAKPLSGDDFFPQL